MLEIVLATRNRHKVAEMSRMLADIAVVRDLTDFPDMPAVEETADSFLGNAIIKAEAVAAHTGRPSLADDSGLEVEALGGAPGVHSARYSGPGATDESNLNKLIAALEGVPESGRRARFVCAIALAAPGQLTWTTTGVHEGVITQSPAGAGGFGYDPIFYSPELQATFAEAPIGKSRVSHRARAIASLRLYLEQRFGT